MDYINEIIYLSKRLLRYESVFGHGGFSTEAIYGKTIVNCQKDMLDYCESIGLTTYLDPEGAYSYAETSPCESQHSDLDQDKEYIAILCHLDVVGAGDLAQWEHPPFDPIIKDNKLIARGTADDKVPAAIAVILVKKLLDEGIHLKYPIRLIFGSDEETGFRGINKYKTIHQPPKYTLVFDGMYPFSYSEKHLLNYELHTNSHLNIHGGVGYNSVMDKVVWTQGDQLTEVLGISAHASKPTLGENALVKLAYLHEGKDILFDMVTQLVEPNGHHKLNLIDDPALNQDMTLNIGIVEDNILYTDVRIPPDVDINAFATAFEATVQALGAKPIQKDVLRGTKTDTESKFASTVLKCYQDITGDTENLPFKTGSATYGRSFDSNCLCFGPRMEYHITNTHKPNEFVPIELIENAFEIYVHTLKTIEEEL
jgi:acetylornithine deacetylase/succinyl-diaminopimelate desuccinylase-like protein